MQFDSSRIETFLTSVYIGICLLEACYGGVWKIMKQYKATMKTTSTLALILIPIIAIVWIAAWPVRFIVSVLRGLDECYRVIMGRK